MTAAFSLCFFILCDLFYVLSKHGFYKLSNFIVFFFDIVTFLTP